MGIIDRVYCVGWRDTIKVQFRVLESECSLFLLETPSFVLFFSYCMDEVPDHKVGIYCNVIGPLAKLRHMHFRAKRFEDILVKFDISQTCV